MIDKNRPAFPVECCLYQKECNYHHGLTKYQHIAIEAMKALLSYNGVWTILRDAESCCKIADDLFAEFERREKQ